MTPATPIRKNFQGLAAVLIAVLVGVGAGTPGKSLEVFGPVVPFAFPCWF